MNILIEILLGVTTFTAVIMTLAAVILVARSRLLPSDKIPVVVNEQRTLDVDAGSKLLEALFEADLFLPSGCGGKGTCGQCRVHLTEGGGSALPTETAILSHREMADGVRLACQVAVREPMSVRISEDVFGVRRWACVVQSNRNVATYIKELVLELPPGENMDFEAGGYVQIECPPYNVKFSDFLVEDQFRPEWERYQLGRFEAGTDEPTSRAYSMANYPGEKGLIKLNVRIATPPPGASDDVPPGIVSSYIFSLKPGQPVSISGPYGEFFVRDTDREMLYIGGGAGMAPLRSHIFDLFRRLKTRRKVSFWYGARSLRELFYVEDFDQLAQEHDNFDWYVALSEPQEEDHWTGLTGFIHDVVYREYLADHPAPEECEYYLCGPPLMISAVMKMLDDLGVDRESIIFDDFGG